MVTNIGEQCIINSVEEQYIEELNEEYFGYANSQQHHQKCSPPSPNQLVQGHDKGTGTH